MFESLPDYRKRVFIVFLNQNDDDLLKECGFLKSDTTRLNKDFKTILMEQNEEHLDHIKNQEESVIERFLDKKMEQIFAVMFEDVRHERSLIIILSLTDLVILRQRKFTSYEIDIIKKLALEKLHRQRIPKEHITISFLETQLKKYFLFFK